MATSLEKWKIALERFMGPSGNDGNEKRVQVFVNDPLPSNYYLTNLPPTKKVETLPHFMDRLTLLSIATYVGEWRPFTQYRINQVVKGPDGDFWFVTRDYVSSASFDWDVENRDLIPYYYGEQGPPGEKGPIGNPGPQGPPGDAGDFGAWDEEKNYLDPTLVFGSDGKIYAWLQQSGPETIAGARDPIDQFESIGGIIPPGAKWNWAPLGASHNLQGSMVVAHSGRIIALSSGTPGTCLYSDSDGNSWNVISNPDVPFGPHQGGMVVTKTGRVIAMSQLHDGYAWYSDNEGENWTRITRPTTGTYATISGIIEAPNGRLIAVGLYSSSPYPTALYSDDNGSTWDILTNLFSGCGGPRSIIATKTGRIIVFGQARNHMYSDDNGDSWKQLPLPAGWSIRVQGAAVLPSGRIVFLVDDAANVTNCAYSDDNGMTWMQVVPSFSSGWNQLWKGSLIATSSGRLIALSQGTDKGIYSDDGGESWVEVALSVAGNWYGSIVETETGRVVALAYSGSYCMYSDEDKTAMGVSWNPYWELLDTTPIGISVFTPGLMASTRRTIQYNGGLLSRADYSALWRRVRKFFDPIDDAVWLADSALADRYSNGDGSTTFRIPLKAYGNGINEFLQAI